jgi:hypothetical protein
MHAGEVQRALRPLSERDDERRGELNEMCGWEWRKFQWMRQKPDIFLLLGLTGSDQSDTRSIALSF